MKTSWKNEWPQWAMLSAMFGLALWRWPLTGNRVPVHWNAAGEIDRYGGKFEGLFFLPLFSLGIYLLMLALPRLDPGRANYAQFAKPYNAIRLAVLALMFVIQGAILLVAAGHKIEMSSVIWSSVGAMMMVIGSVLGKIRPNWLVGIRTPWTLSSKTAWVKTHRFGGWVFLGMGALQIVMGLTLPPALAVHWLVRIILLGSLGLSGYSYLAWKDADDKAPPAGTMPAEEIRA